MKRCAWVPADDPLYVAYHDDEWGVPVYHDAGLFELLTLEGAQAGLSWRTILGKRDGYRRLFHGFEPAAVAAMTTTDVDRLIEDPAIVRHRGKIESTVTNARAILALPGGDFARFIWGFVGGRPVDGNRRAVTDLPAQTELSRRASVELKRTGFRFVGATTVYSFFQAGGLINDHTLDCFRHAEVLRLSGGG